MQVLDDENPLQSLMKKMQVPALPFIEEQKSVEEPTEEKTTKVPQRISKSEKKRQRDEFLGRVTQHEIVEPVIENREFIEPQVEQVEDIHSEHDGKRLMGWMSEALESIRQKMEYCKSPPISDDPTENREIKKQVRQYKEITQYNDADSIMDYIEGLQWYGRINPDLFGKENYLLDNTILGAKEIYEKLEECKSNLNHDDAMRYLNKLVICAARPLVVDELLMKETEYEPSNTDSGVSQGTYEPQDE